MVFIFNVFRFQSSSNARKLQPLKLIPRYTERICSLYSTSYTSKWPKTALTEIGSRDLIYIQTSK